MSQSASREKQLLRLLTFETALSTDYLLADSEKVKVKRLRNRDIKRASQTIMDAAERDPMNIYVRDTPDAPNPPISRRIERLQYILGLQQRVRRKMTLTVNNGRAVVCALPAPEADKKSKLDKQLDKLYRLVWHVISLIGMSKEQRRRLEEVQVKLDKLVEEALGAHAKEMRCVNTLATAPAFQRRGYGGALVDAVTRLADAEGRSTYLLSSNPVNTEFYNSHGFFTIAEVLIGEDNPTWKRPPVPIPLMVRIFGDQ